MPCKAVANVEHYLISSKMPTLALFTRPPQPNASHTVLAPGGFERWHFDAEDSSGAHRLTIDFYEGFPFHPTYLRRYHQYLRSPTRTSPPLPQQFRAVSFTLFDVTKAVARLFRLADNFGPNSMATDKNGTIRIQLRGAPFHVRESGPALLDQQTLNAEFVFTPRGMSQTDSLDPLADASEYQQYQVSRSICDVSGEVHVYGQGPGSAPLDLRFDGRGFFDHDLGLSPMSECLARVMYGRVLLLRDRALVFEVMEEQSPAMTRGELVQLDASGQRNLDAGEMKIDWRATTLHVGAPPRVTFSDQLDLSNPRVLDSNAVSAWVVYDATARGENGTALCEVIHPKRVDSFMQGMRLKRRFDRANSARDERGGLT
jgi:hypothetical protein